jgi:hypothetical protein
MTQANLDRDTRVRDALYRTRLLANRTPHFSKATRKDLRRKFRKTAKAAPIA